MKRVLVSIAIVAGTICFAIVVRQHHGALDDHTGYYGPVIRRVEDVPYGVLDAMCEHHIGKCIAEPGQDFNSGDFAPQPPTQQLVWVRRFGNLYVTYRLVGGSNEDVEFDVFTAQERDKAQYRLIWSETSYDDSLAVESKRPRLYPPPAGLDRRVINLVYYTLRAHEACVSLGQQAGPASAGCGWPFK